MFSLLLNDLIDNRLTYTMLKHQLKPGRISCRDIPPVKAYNVFDMSFVRVGKKRTKSLQEAKDEILDVIKISVGNAFDLLDDLRKKRNAVTVTYVWQLDKIVWSCLYMGSVV